MIRETRRWHGIVAVSLFAGAISLLSQRSSVLLLAAIGIGYAAYPRIASTPPTAQLGVERTIEPKVPGVDETVDVTVTVTNEGDRWLPDLRIVDGVPPLLSVVDGTPRHATALGPGRTATFEYELKALPGRHRFEPMTVLCRSVSGSTERRTSFMEPTVIDCTTPVTSTTLRRITGFISGREVTDQGGDGIEFHRTREYQPGDPRNRIDWRRVAKTGELSTIDFREERAASVVLCIDTRSERLADGLAYSVVAADLLATALISEGHEVGVTTLGTQSIWIPPGVGSDHLTRIRHAIDTEPSFETAVRESGSDEEALTDAQSPAAASRSATDGGRAVRSDDPTGTDTLRQRLGPNAQVALVTPLTDDSVVDAARTLEVAGRPTFVVSPDVTARETLGQRTAALERSLRCRRLRGTGIPVVDWDIESDLDIDVGGIE